MAPQVEKKTAPSLAVPIAVEDDLDGTSKRKKGEETPGFDHGGRRKSGEKTMIGDGIWRKMKLDGFEKVKKAVENGISMWKLWESESGRLWYLNI